MQPTHSLIDMARTVVYRTFIEQRVRLLTSTCDPKYDNFEITAILSIAQEMDVGLADPLAPIEVVEVSVAGKGRARVKLRPAPLDAWAERKMTLLAISPPSVLPSCIQGLFQQKTHNVMAGLLANRSSTAALRSCTMAGGRRMRSILVARERPSSLECMRPVMDDVAAAALALVVTWSAAGVAAQSGHREIHALGEMLFANRTSRLGRTRAVLFGKGSRCTIAGEMPLVRHVAEGRAHCIEGPNVGAREAHTIWSFCHDFYHHLPRVALFIQDDPQLGTILRDLAKANWVAQLEASYQDRRSAATAVADPRMLEPWQPAACSCAPVREAFDMRLHGYYRPIIWWMRSFLAPYANASAPKQLLWPATAQFAMPRAAIAGRSREYYALHTRLTEVPAPLKRKVARKALTSDSEYQRAAREANFGPIVVDLGAAPPKAAGYADRHEGIHGYDLAQLFERSWFAAFDPALAEGRPAQLRCLQRDAIAQGPLRCPATVCSHKWSSERSHPGGCRVTDQLGLTVPPPAWRFTVLGARCVSPGCIVKPQHGSAAWV